MKYAIASTLCLPLLVACSQGGEERVSDVGSSATVASDGVASSTPMGTSVQPTTLPATAPDGTPVARIGQLRIDGTQLVGADGAPVQLKGPSSMWLHWEKTGYAHNPLTVEFLRDDWGATIIRAAMGVEPDGAYLARPEQANTAVRLVIDVAIQLGMYVIVDWHDHEAHLHEEQAVEFFKAIATEYGDRPNIIYEVFNEPKQIDWSSELKPYHDRLVSEIRAIDPDNVIILGTPQWSQRVNDPVADPVIGTNLMYALHFYSCPHTQWLRDDATNAIASGLPLFVTEWGASHEDGGTSDNPSLCLEDAQLWHDWMNTNSVSWTAWKLDDCNDVTCFFAPGTSVLGNWTDDQLNGHTLFVRDRMRE